MALEFVFKYSIFLGADNYQGLMVWQASATALYISALRVVDEHWLSLLSFCCLQTSLVKADSLCSAN